MFGQRIQRINELPEDARVLPDGEITYADNDKPKEHFLDEQTGQYVKVMFSGNASSRAWWMTALVVFPLYFTYRKGIMRMQLLSLQFSFLFCLQVSKLTHQEDVQLILSYLLLTLF